MTRCTSQPAFPPPHVSASMRKGATRLWLVLYFTVVICHPLDAHCEEVHSDTRPFTRAVLHGGFFSRSNPTAFVLHVAVALNKQAFLISAVERTETNGLFGSLRIACDSQNIAGSVSWQPTEAGYRVTVTLTQPGPELLHDGSDTGAAKRLQRMARNLLHEVEATDYGKREQVMPSTAGEGGQQP